MDTTAIPTPRTDAMAFDVMDNGNIRRRPSGSCCDASDVRALERELISLKAPWTDKPDKYSEAIESAHPMNSGSDETYAQALDMVGNRHSKYALVDLVNWLLTENESLRQSLAEVKAVAESKGIQNTI